MKCVCGYEGNDFKKLDKVAEYRKEVREPHEEEGRIRFYMCPECGTIRGEE